MNKRYVGYDDYRDSGEKWLGQIPTSWTATQIGYLTRVKRGASPRPIENEKYFDDEGEYAWTRISDVTASDVYLTESPQRLSDLGSALSVKLEPGELFLSIAATVGKPCITAIKACIHDGFVYFPDLQVPTKLLFYIFAAGQAYKGLGKMGTQLNLNTDTVGRIKIGLGTHEEQKQIAKFLDYETAKIDALIEKQEQLIALLKEKRQAVISHAVTKGLNPDAPMRDSGVEWLGEVPAHWTVSSIKYLASAISKGTTPSTLGRDIVDEGIRFIKGENVGKGLAVSKLPEFYITKETDELLGRSQLKNGDVLVIIAGATTGLCSVVTKDILPANTNQAVSYIRPIFQQHSILISRWLSTEYAQRRIWMGAVQAAQPNLSMEDLGNIPILVPPLIELEEILKKISVLTENLDSLIQRVTRMSDLLKERRTALISAAVTGKIDVRDWKHPDELEKEKR